MRFYQASMSNTSDPLWLQAVQLKIPKIARRAPSESLQTINKAQNPQARMKYCPGTENSVSPCLLLSCNEAVRLELIISGRPLDNGSL